MLHFLTLRCRNGRGSQSVDQIVGHLQLQLEKKANEVVENHSGPSLMESIFQASATDKIMASANSGRIRHHLAHIVVNQASNPSDRRVLVSNR
jgi:hypothetical protein